MSGLRFVEKLANAPWLCSPDHVEFLHSVFLRYLDRAASGEKLDVRSVEQVTGQRLDNTRSVTNKDGVARIPVEGTIVRRGSLFSEVSGMVSTETIAKDFVAALNDNTVHSVLFVFDTPGGEAYGINELATLIRDNRGEKRIEAFCDGMCASAGYYLASATERITAEPTASVGSIGTVVRVFNPQAAGKSPYLEFVNARSPNKRPDPNTAAGRNAIQEWIDEMGDQFIQFVAESRGVSFEKVEQDFGQGFVMTGKRALSVGMVDALGSEGAVVGRLQEEGRKRTGPTKRLRPAAHDPLPSHDSAAPTNGNEEVATHVSENADQTVAEVREETEAPSAGEGRAEGILARIRTILVGEDLPTLPSTDWDAYANDETREDMTETTEGRTETSTEAELRAQLEEAERENADLRAQVEALRGDNDEAVKALAEERVDAELAAYCGEGKDGGVPPWQADAARPDLLEAALEPENAAAQERASRWRAVLDGARGTVKFGERGVADAEAVEDDGETPESKIRQLMQDEGISYREAAVCLSGEGE